MLWAERGDATKLWASGDKFTDLGFCLFVVCFGGGGGGGGGGGCFVFLLFCFFVSWASILCAVQEACARPLTTGSRQLLLVQDYTTFVFNQGPVLEHGACHPEAYGHD